MTDHRPCFMKMRAFGMCPRCGYSRWDWRYLYARCVRGDSMADKVRDLEEWQRLGKAHLRARAEEAK